MLTHYLQEMFAYNLDQSTANSLNLLTVLVMSSQPPPSEDQIKYALQPALLTVAHLVRTAFQVFRDTEALFFSRLKRPCSSPDTSETDSWLSQWTTAPFSFLQPAADAADQPGTALVEASSEVTVHDRERERYARLYVNGLKDLIVGSLNWAFESELWFDKTGEEVRTFGWVFLKEKRA